MEIRLPTALAESGRFEVRECLGTGAFGVVWAARDLERGTDVALKWLKQGDAATIARFKREFRSLADLVHPNLVTLRDLLVYDDEWFFTMDRLDGIDLLRWVRPASPVLGGPSGASTATALDAQAMPTALAEGPGRSPSDLPPRPSQSPPAVVRITDAHRPLAAADLPRVRRTFEQLAAGLLALHGAGMIHRDIKPSNVLVTREGRVVLLDFGLVTDLGHDGIAETMKGRIVGTPAYMSPEQALGMPLTPESDWYSVGAMLYQALTGQLPYEGDPQEVLFRKQLADPAPPTDLVRGVPKTLSDLCLELLSRKPSARPIGARFLERLGAALPFGDPTIESDGAAGMTAPPLPRAAVGSDAPRAAGSVAAPVPGGIPLVGRETHLWALDEALDTTQDGKAVIALVHGSSGMGKSTLVRHFLEHVRKERPHAVILEGRCYAREAVPYKAVDALADALCRYLQRLPKVQSNALLPRDLPLLAKLFPTFLQIDGAAVRRHRGPSDVVQERRRAFEALRELLQRISDESPLVVYVDDLQWGDVDSEPLLATLLRAPDPPAMLFIAAYREEEASAPLVVALERIAVAGAGVELCDVPVAELAADAARELARTLLGGVADERRAEEIARESSGSPLFLRQLAALGASDVSVGLSEAVARRVEALGDEPRRMLEVLAVSGRPLPLPVASLAADISKDRDGVVAQLRAESLVRTRMVDARDEVEVYHDRIREVVVASLPAKVLEAHHKAIAHALAKGGTDDPEAIAEHLVAGSERELAAEYAQKAAERAAEALAFDRAARMYQMAIDLETTLGRDVPRLTVRLAEALACAGRGRDAAGQFLVAAERATGSEAIELRRQAAEQLLFSGHLEEGQRVVVQILTALRMKMPAGRIATLVTLALGRVWLRLRGHGFRRRSEGEIPRDRLVRIDACFGLARGLGVIDTVRGATFQVKYILLALAAGEPVRIAMALALEIAYTATAGETARARVLALSERAMDLAVETDNAHAIGLVLLMRSIAKNLLGEFQEAHTLGDDAMTILRERCTNVTWEIDNAAFFSNYALMMLGRIRELRARMPWHLDDVRARGDLYGEILLRTQLTYFVRLVDDDATGAWADLAVLEDRWPTGTETLQFAWKTVSTVDVLLYLGDPGKAWETVEAAWPVMKRGLLLGVQSVRVRVMNARARATLAAGLAAKGAEREELLAKAASFANAIGRESWALTKGWSLLLLGCIAAARGETEAASRTLRDAIVELDRRGLAIFAASARMRLGALTATEEGRGLVTTAENALREEGARKPEAFARVFAPGAEQRP